MADEFDEAELEQLETDTKKANRFFEDSKGRFDRLEGLMEAILLKLDKLDGKMESSDKSGFKVGSSSNAIMPAHNRQSGIPIVPPGNSSQPLTETTPMDLSGSDSDSIPDSVTILAAKDEVHPGAAAIGDDADDIIKVEAEFVLDETEQGSNPSPPTVDKKLLIDPSHDSGTVLDRVRGEIEPHHISFKHPSRRDVQIFRDLSLAIHSRQTVTLVGEIRRVKSTVISSLVVIHPICSRILNSVNLSLSASDLLQVSVSLHFIFIYDPGPRISSHFSLPSSHIIEEGFAQALHIPWKRDYTAAERLFHSFMVKISHPNLRTNIKTLYNFSGNQVLITSCPSWKPILIFCMKLCLITIKMVASYCISKSLCGPLQIDETSHAHAPCYAFSFVDNHHSMNNSKGWLSKLIAIKPIIKMAPLFLEIQLFQENYGTMIEEFTTYFAKGCGCITTGTVLYLEAPVQISDHIMFGFGKYEPKRSHALLHFHQLLFSFKLGTLILLHPNACSFFLTLWPYKYLDYEAFDMWCISIKFCMPLNYGIYTDFTMGRHCYHIAMKFHRAAASNIYILCDEHFPELEYLLFGLVSAVPSFLIPMLFVGNAANNLFGKDCYWVKVSLWIITSSYVGKYSWTHYLLFTLVCFSLCRLRNFTTDLPHIIRWDTEAAWVLAISYFTSYLETLTISNFPYYQFVDRGVMYNVGSLFYVIHFIVSFPMSVRIDEIFEYYWDLSRVVVDALGSTMLVTIILDLWHTRVAIEETQAKQLLIDNLHILMTCDFGPNFLVHFTPMEMQCRPPVVSHDWLYSCLLPYFNYSVEVPRNYMSGSFFLILRHVRTCTGFLVAAIQQEMFTHGFAIALQVNNYDMELVSLTEGDYCIHQRIIFASTVESSLICLYGKGTTYRKYTIMVLYLDKVGEDKTDTITCAMHQYYFCTQQAEHEIISAVAPPLHWVMYMNLLMHLRLVRWNGLDPPTCITWAALQVNFSNLDLEGKVHFNGGGNVMFMKYWATIKPKYQPKTRAIVRSLKGRAEGRTRQEMIWLFSSLRQTLSLSILSFPFL